MKKQVITAVAFLINDKNQLFVAKRADTKKFMPGIWELPGGHIEFGESLSEGLRREIMEEFGVYIEVGRPFDSFTYICDDGLEHVLEIACHATLAHGQKPRLNPKDHSGFKWINDYEVEKYLEENQAEMKVAINGFKSILDSGSRAESYPLGSGMTKIK